MSTQFPDAQLPNAATVGVLSVRPYYDHGGITIYHGDCREIVPQLGKFDLILTDPPYGIGAGGGTGKYGKGKSSFCYGSWDGETVKQEDLAAVIQCSSKQIVWGMNYYQFHPCRQYFVWDKGEGFKGRDFAECELAWCSWDGNARIFKRDPLARGDYKGKMHPTQKPVSLMTWCLGFTPDAKTVLDPFMGSGTTLVACKDRGLRCVGIDTNEAYCEIAASRLAQEILIAV